MDGRYELRILGAPDLRAPDGRRLTSVLSQPSRLSLLAYLALAPGPVTRAAVVADFWPESDETRARNALSQAVFHLRRSLDKQTVRSVEGDRLWVPPERLWCDARALLTEPRPPEDVVRSADEELLAGWNADGSQPLQEWLDSQRRKVRERAEELRAREAAAESPAVAAGGAPEATAPRAERTTFGRRAWIPVSVTAGLLALVLAAVVPGLRRPPGGAEPTRLVVLQPRVNASPGAPELSALTLNAELIARLPERAGVEVVSAPFASTLQDLARQRTQIVGPQGEVADLPEWILDVGVTVGADSVHVTALLYRGSGFGVPGRDRFDFAWDDAGTLVVEMPRTVAEEVARMVARVL